ncbi:MAG: HAD-superfamily hydrolase, subfamily variant 1 [Ilumatobacteraceae bacterium]|nr:HAD-superfamily hydrolase, subfamily variant 1 [Ilumatobacteraceae bacterium]
MARSGAPLKAVTFDFWNTLLDAETAGIRDRRLTAKLGVLAEAGFDVDGEIVRGAMRHAGQQFDRRWRENQYYGAQHAIDDIVEQLGIDASPELRAGLLATITDPDPAHDPKPTPHIGEALEGLRSAGIRIGIICDVGLAPSTTLRRFLVGHGLLEYFDHWSFSDEVGTFKPDPAIFDHALTGLGGIAPGEAAHVGDLRRTDIAGAQGHGVFAVRYAGIFGDPGRAEDGSDGVEGDAVIADHADLLAALGLA